MRKKAKAATGGDLLQQILGEDASDRRVVILRALWRLMKEKGYAGTSLTDVARRSRISPSHLTYYFATKEAILLELYQALTRAILREVTAPADSEPIEQFHQLARYVFLEPIIDLDDRSILLELVGIAVHNPRLRRRLYDYAQGMFDYLRELFAKTPRAYGLSAQDAAMLAGSIWMGLLTNSYFYKKFDLSRAQALFLDSLLMLAGLVEPRFSLADQSAGRSRVYSASR